MTITLTPTFIYISALNAVSIIFLIFSLIKLRGVLKFLTLEENNYTLLFGFIGVRMYIYLYVLSILLLSLFLWIITA